ncbi:MAG: penicillin acylase family protein [Chloroflexi bacterium]|nr:penicillin acylase family protein [Chloroflexota bacterium]
MRTLRRIILTLLAVVLIIAFVAAGGAYFFITRSHPTINGTIKVPGLQADVQIYRDRWGVPHIYAQNLHDLIFAQGYVHAQDRLWQMEFNRRVAAGRLSEVLGEATLKSDRYLRTIGLYRAAQKDLEVLDAETIAILQAYADGVNAFISTHQNNLPLEFTLLGFKPAPWTPLDSLGWGKVMAMDLSGNYDSELLRAKLLTVLSEEEIHELLPPYPAQGPFIIPPEARQYSSLVDPLLEEWLAVRNTLQIGWEGVGSNNWVVDGTMTASGKPLLANDPHLGIQNPSIWYEVHLVGGGLDVIGASFPGVPLVIIGHNQNIAWGVTNVGPDVQDLYIEKINPDNPNQYEYKGRWEDMQVIREEILVKGRSEPEILNVRVTRHGPIMSPVVGVEDQALALRWTALEGGMLFKSVMMLNYAGNWEEFRQALRYWAVPSQNFVYADRQGNIGYQTPGNIPIRAQGQGLVSVPGWTGEYEWTGYIPFEELPSVYNPPNHYIVTANNKVVPDYYPYFISAEWAAPWRAMRIESQIRGRSGLTIRDMRDIQADTYSIPGSIITPYILQLKPEGWLEERAMAELAKWDYRDEIDSIGASIFAATFYFLARNTFADELGLDPTASYTGSGDMTSRVLVMLMEQPDSHWWDNTATPAVEKRDDILHQSFAQALELLGRRYGDMPSEWRWGRLHTANFNHVVGSVKPLNLLFNIEGVRARGSGFTPCAAGFDWNDPFEVRVLASYRQIIDLSNLNASVSAHTVGQSGQPLHAHWGDQVKLWQAVEHHPMLYDRAVIEQDREGLLVLTPK